MTAGAARPRHHVDARLGSLISERSSIQHYVNEDGSNVTIHHVGFKAFLDAQLADDPSWTDAIEPRW
jgi:hypothetical protein